MWKDLDAVANQTVVVTKKCKIPEIPYLNCALEQDCLTTGRPEGTRLFVAPNKNHLMPVTRATY